MKCFVTGASGYVGSRVCLRLQEDGHEVVLLQRSPNATDTKAWVISFQLGSKIDPGFFQGADALDSLRLGYAGDWVGSNP